jgi:hypothetical protein
LRFKTSLSVNTEYAQCKASFPLRQCYRRRTFYLSPVGFADLGVDHETKKWVVVARTTTRVRKERNNLLLGAAKLYHGLSFENGFELLL